MAAGRLRFNELIYLKLPLPQYDSLHLTIRFALNQTHAPTEKLVGQLRVLHQLTNSEIQLAQTRQAQARDETVRQQFTTNAANAQERAALIAATLRALGGVPDVITPALGRATALAKSVIEQGQPLTGALFGDLYLEHQLPDRARYLEALADAADHNEARLLARRLQAAHHETVSWITSVLVEEASGEVTAVHPPAVRTRSRVATVTGAAADSLAAGRDAGLHQAEEIANRKGAHATADRLHRTRVLTGGLSEEELIVDQYDDLTVNEVEPAVQKLSDITAVTALLRYEHNHKDRAGASSAIENQLNALKLRASTRN
jgi:hypothetical protein